MKMSATDNGEQGREMNSELLHAHTTEYNELIAKITAVRDFAINEFNDRVASADFAEALNESESTESNKCSKICEFDCVEWDTGGIAGLDLKLADVDRALEATKKAKHLVQMLGHELDVKCGKLENQKHEVEKLKLERKEKERREQAKN